MIQGFNPQMLQQMMGGGMAGISLPQGMTQQIQQAQAQMMKIIGEAFKGMSLNPGSLGGGKGMENADPVAFMLKIVRGEMAMPFDTPGPGTFGLQASLGGNLGGLLGSGGLEGLKPG